MIQRDHGELTGRLTQLETGGRDLLTRRADRAARAQARDVAWQSAPVMPALALVAVLLGGGGAAVWTMGALIVPALVFAATWLVLRRRIVIDRRAALALLDDRFALQDRLSTTEQFLREPARDGFRAAAIDEAAPWIERALDSPIADETDAARPDRRRWPFLAAGAALLLAAWLVHPRIPDAPASSDAAARRQATGAPADAARDAAPVDTASTPIERIAAAVAARVRAAFGGAAGTPAATSGRASPGGSGGGAGETAATAVGAADAGSGAPAGAAAGRGQAMAGQAGTAGARSRDAAQEEAGQPATAASIADGEAAADDDGGGEMQAAATARTQGSPFGAPGAAPPASGSRSGRNDSNGEQQQSGRSQNGEQNSSQPGQGDGSGENGQRGGTTNTLKTSRGVAGLLLAAPAEDRLIGTPGRGPVTSIGRPGVPRAAAADGVAAQDRGAAGGGLRAGARDPASRHDDRLVGAFFDRRGAR